ncbi:MAG: cyclic nucleotide-binding domain-containing protein [Bacteroidetes bacterium]|nr:cyclic nucleotide-binding domain-containing protein [Bacteroidota bacterium]
MHRFTSMLEIRKYKKRYILQPVGKIPNEVLFIHSGLIRVCLDDYSGKEHSIHFATESQFIADYSNFILNEPAVYRLEAMENLEVVVLPRAAIEWGYTHLQEGEKLGRMIAEFYFIYHDNRIRNQYMRTPKERYEAIQHVFPDIHQRVPQHMIASYLGITPIHLSRLKKEAKV